MHLMQYERGMYGYAVLTTALTELSRLRAAMAAHGASPASRERFAQIYVAVVRHSLGPRPRCGHWHRAAWSARIAHR